MSRNISSNWSAALVAMLRKLGVKHVAISPGYRNSSLVQAFTSDKLLSCHSFIDERSASFFALGSAKSTGTPTVVVSTSGTAVANFFPAVVEASLSSSPMIVVTADRPRELIGTGENQAIDQHKIFGNFVRSFADIGLPNKDLQSLKKEVIDSYKSSMGLGSLSIPPGPVHINCPFKMPILNYLDIEETDITLDASSKINQPKVEGFDPGPRPLIVCGGMNVCSNYKKIIELAKHWNAPIFADPTSQVKFSSSSSLLIDAYDLMLRYTDLSPSLIVRFGSKPTSKSLNNLLNKNKSKVVVVGKYQQFNDDADIYIQSSNKSFSLTQISETAKNNNSSWHESIASKSTKIKAVINNHSNRSVVEPLIYSEIVTMLDSEDNLFVGSSMPIRDMDSYTAPCNKKIKVLSNRGASGIDGLIASASGMSISSNKKNVLVLGDVSFAHDLGTLADATKSEINLTIVVINNQGGNIFNQLPIKEYVKKVYKKFWLTPPNIDIKSICKAFKTVYIKATNLAEFRDAFSRALSLNGLKVVEVLCDVEGDNKFRERVLKELQAS